MIKRYSFVRVCPCQTSRTERLNDISGSFGKQAEKPRSGDGDALHE